MADTVRIELFLTPREADELRRLLPQTARLGGRLPHPDGHAALTKLLDQLNRV